MQIYNTSSQSFVSLFEPLPPTQPTPTNSAQTGKSPTSLTLRPPSSTSSSTPSGPNNPSSDVNYSSSSKKAVAIGASLGAFAFLVILSGTAYYLRRRQQVQGGVRFIALGGDERGNGADSPHFDGEIPVVSTCGDPVASVHGRNRGLLSSLGLAGAISAATRMRNVGSTYQRRDMLADEDTRSFGEWYASRGGDGTGGSSWSLKSILGGGTRLASREASTGSRGTNAGGRNTPWREKSDLADGTSLLRDEDTGVMEVVTTSGPTRSRANGRRLMSQASSKSGLSYKDPFSDPVQEERRQRSDASDPFLGEDEIEDPLRFSVRHVPVLPSIVTTLPLSQGGHALSPLSEHTHTSHHTLTIPESSTAASSRAHSSEPEMTSFGGSSSFGTSRTSVDPFPPSSSIIGTVCDDMPRTDSWWTRLTRTTLLDRKLSNASRKSVTGGKFEIRDPKPPPRLDAIAENVRLGSSSQTSQEEPSLQQQPTLGRAVSVVFETGHEKSMSSLRTADSEAIERMAGTMDVFQRVKTRSNSNRTTTGSINSTGGISTDTLGSSVDAGHDNYVNGGGSSQGILSDDLPTFPSPVEISPSLSSPPLLPTPSSPKEDSIRPIASPLPLLLKSTPMSPSSPSVADRIQALEKRMSLEQQTSSPAATNTKYREERTKKRVTVDYGLVPRASLFVANPDSHRHLSSSGDS